MVLFPETLVEQTLHTPGASYSFLKDLCLPASQTARQGLEQAFGRLPESVQSHFLNLLLSMDNRRFFQGYAEIASIVAMEASGWAIQGMQNGCFELSSSEGTLLLSVLALLQQRRPAGEAELSHRLRTSLGKISTTHRFSILVRRWLPPDLDPEPVRRALELWLAQVDQGQWQGRYAAYEDDRISLEFSLTGEQCKPDQEPVAFCLGPFLAHRTMEVLEPRTVAELDRYQATRDRHRPLVLACVTDQRWQLNEGYLRDFLYGRATSIQSESSEQVLEYNGSGSVSIFRDPLYASTSAYLLIDRPEMDHQLRVRGWLNPWARQPLSAAQGWPCFAERDRSNKGMARLLQWHKTGRTRIPLE